MYHLGLMAECQGSALRNGGWESGVGVGVAYIYIDSPRAGDTLGH